MGRRAKPLKKNAEAKRPPAGKPPKNDDARVRDLEKRLAESLEREKAAGEILRVISSSPTDLQPVLDALAESATRLCASYDANIFRLDGDVLRLVAHHGPLIVPLGHVVSATRGSVTGRAVLDRQTVQAADLQTEVDEFPDSSPTAQKFGYRTTLGVPLLREGKAIGAISLRRTEVQPFTDKQIALLQTFADQAVIAIENARLFTELQARNADLTEALEQQTATAEILRVISSSPTDTQPVFDAIAANAARLCSANDAQVLRVDGDVLRLVAAFGAPSMPPVRRLTRGHLVGRAVIDRRTIHVGSHAEARADYPETTSGQFNVESALAVPLLREGVPLGVIRISRTEIRPFTDKQAALLQTFAAQAVIAIENVRLFKELEARNRDLTEALTRQTATSEILRVISSSPTDAQPVFDAIARNAVVLCGGIRALVLRFDGERLHVAGHYNMSLDVVDRVGQAFPRHPGREYPPDQALLDRSVVHVPDLQAATEFAASTAWQRGVRSLLAVPLLREQEAVGVISLARDVVGPFSPPQIEVLQTFADQAVIAIENVRLFNELEAANRGLRAASQHKSEFLANMSHELRTPLNAVIGFSEVLTERMFGELNEKQDEYLKDIYASGQHLLSLINDILDLSKIEAGRMELELADFHLPSAVENALILVRERASRRGIALGHTIDSGLGMVRADERKVKQVLLNLLSNALKFTPEGGRADVRAGVRDGLAEISVADTGVGIAPEDQEAVFEEFRQVGKAAKKVEGTGLGLALSRKFVELHGGRIWVRSQVGEGSTFTFTLPVRREEMGA